MAGNNIDWTKYGEAICVATLGAPNKSLSRGDDLRFGSNGSLSFDRRRAVFTDHQIGSDQPGGSGGVVELMRREWGADWQETLLSKRILDREDEASLTKGRRRTNGASSYPDDYGGGDRDEAPIDDEEARRAAAHIGADGKAISHKPRITATYDYRDAHGTLIYQVVRKEWIKEGKRRKTFHQRRPSPSGGWINNLNGVDHQLYGLQDLADVTPGEDPVFLAEGEKDVDRLKASGLVATTNSGGAKTWTEEHAKALAGHWVVMLQDNDDAGRARVAKVGPSLVKHCEKVSALDLSEIWADIDEKEDITDWFDRGGGTAVALDKIARELPAWRPTAPTSKFGALRLADINKPGPEHEFLIKGILTRGEVSMLVGPSGSGKSFEATDISLAIARGIEFMGRRTLQGGVVYIAGEGGRGLKKRLRAYLQHHQIDAAEADVPFVLLTLPIDLHSSDADMNALIAEVLQHAATFTVPLELVIIDTLSAATPGANENASEDMTRVLARIGKIKDAVASAVMLVHHMNAAGTKARGHSSIFANVDSVIEVVKDEKRQDSNGRAIRVAKLVKQKDGDDGTTWEFVLRKVRIGQDADGDPITSCVVDYPADQPAPPEQGELVDVSADDRARLGDELFIAFKGLTNALRAHGRPAPSKAGAPANTDAVTVAEWLDAYLSLKRSGDEGDEEKFKERVKKARDRAAANLMQRGIIGRSEGYVWRTKRRVAGIDPRFRDDDRGRNKDEDSPLMSDADKQDLPF